MPPRPARPVDLGWNAPIEVDWTDPRWLNRAMNGKVVIPSPIRNQGDLATCGCHALSTALEAAHNILNYDKEPISLSVQELIDYDSSDFKKIGITQFKSLTKFIRKKRLSQEMHYKYKEGQKFKLNRKKNLSKAKGMGKLEQFDVVDEREVLKLVEVKPVIMVLNQGREFGSLNNTAGIYMGPDPGQGRNNAHAVLIVGYGTANGINFWKVRNSYGVQWGEDGYARIRRASSNNGVSFIRSYATVEARLD